MIHFGNHVKPTCKKRYNKMSNRWLQLVNDNYSAWETTSCRKTCLLFCTNGRTKHLWKLLAERTANTHRASKETRRAAKKASTGLEAVRLIFDLGMPKRRYVA